MYALLLAFTHDQREKGEELNTLRENQRSN
jgi:hypothetical protein